MPTYLQLVPHLVAQNHAEGQHDEEDEDKGVREPLARLLVVEQRRGAAAPGRSGGLFGRRHP